MWFPQCLPVYSPIVPSFAPLHEYTLHSQGEQSDMPLKWLLPSKEQQPRVVTDHGKPPHPGWLLEDMNPW